MRGVEHGVFAVDRSLLYQLLQRFLLGERSLAATAGVQGDSFADTEKDLKRYGANSP